MRPKWLCCTFELDFLCVKLIKLISCLLLWQYNQVHTFQITKKRTHPLLYFYSTINQNFEPPFFIFSPRLFFSLRQKKIHITFFSLRRKNTHHFFSLRQKNAHHFFFSKTKKCTSFFFL